MIKQRFLTTLLMGSIAAGAWAQADKGETSVDKTVDLNPVVEPVRVRISD